MDEWSEAMRDDVSELDYDYPYSHQEVSLRLSERDYEHLEYLARELQGSLVEVVCLVAYNPYLEAAGIFADDLVLSRITALASVERRRQRAALASEADAQ